MAPIDPVLADLESYDLEVVPCIQTIATKHGVDRSTLSKRWRGVTRSHEEGYAAQQALTPEEEYELVLYVEHLTSNGLPPTRPMVRNFASTIAKTRVSEAWATRFISRYECDLTTKWTTGMDAVRHKADAGSKYNLYYDLLHPKMSKYEILPRNSYNMDEKGFMVGVTTRSKRVFSRRQYEKKELTASLQDGNREWITLVATICADGTALPPALIFQSKNCTMQAPVVADIQAGKHQVHVSSTPSG